ncbi:MAG: carbohydrate binding domain-containing protein [Candidatus Omnitrophota bacterium]
MRRIGLLVLAFVLTATVVCFADNNVLLIEDFEGPVSGGPEGTVDFGAGNGSSVEVAAATDIKQSGNQSLKVVYDAVPDGYMWIAKGFNLDAKNTAWKVKPEDIKWEEYNAITFYMYGSDSKANIAFDVKDNNQEIWRFIVEDNFKGWKQIVARFDQFFVRDDWQPDVAEKNGILDFPLKSFQFEPRPEAKGTIYFDVVELIKQE